MKQSYYAIIPADVRYNKNITANAKLLYGEITALCNQEGYCWASNAYFAELYDVSNVSVSKWINSLEKEGYTHIEIDEKNGNKRLIFLKEVLKKSLIGHKEKFKTPIKEKFKHNNTSLNNTNNITSIISYLNDKSNKNFKPNATNSKKHIQARLNEGYKIEDFKTVIDKKIKQWGKDTKMSAFIRPETLFGTKFDSYLNEIEAKSSFDLSGKQYDSEKDF